MSLDLATALYLADKLDRPDCAKARGIINKEITTEKLRREVEMPQRDQVLACCAIAFAMLCMAWGVLR